MLRTYSPLTLSKLKENRPSSGVFISQQALSEFQRASTVLDSFATESTLDIPHPPGIDYLPFQRAGISYAAQHLLTLIGDEPGTGKTIQAIGLSNYLREISRVLIISPAFLKLNWRDEWKIWDVKNLSVGIASGTKSTLPEKDVVIINYDILKAYRNELRRFKWDLLIADEAHRLKNKRTERSREVLGGIKRDHNKKIIDRVSAIPATRKLFLTGTPSLNGKPKELWPLLQALDPSALGSDWYAYAQRYCGLQEITQYDFNTGKRERIGWWWDGATNLGELQNRMRATFLVRRLKADVLKDLPEKIRVVLPVEVGGMKKKLFQQLKSFEEFARETADKFENMPSFEGFSEMLHETGLVLVKPGIEVIKDELEEQDKIVVMTYHKDVAEKIFERFQGISVLITGDVLPEKRGVMVKSFQTESRLRLCIGTMGAMSEGLTMTAASVMIFIERDWVPGNISQAEDRIHRIGQGNQVVYKHLVLADSLGERQIRSYVSKQSNSNKMLDKPREV